MAYKEEIEYTAAAFQRLIEAVSDEGGLYLDGLCSMREYTFTGPHAKDIVGDPAVIPGCGHPALFEVPYEGEDGQPHPHVMCAVCDHMGYMPRYAHVMIERPA